MTSSYHTGWSVPSEHREDPAYRAAGRCMDFALAICERRSALGLSSAELADRAGLSVEEVERIEESDVDPTLELIESLAEALHSGALIDPRATPEFRFESRAA